MSDTRIEEEEGAAPLPDGELTAKQELALSAVITHATLKEAAAAAGISETTLWRYTKEEAFARRLREARREVFSHACARLQGAAADAAAALHDLVKDGHKPVAVRVTAARAIIDQSRRSLEHDDLRAQIDELERHILSMRDEAVERAA